MPASATLAKLTPDRTMHLRGFDRRGAAAAFHSAHASGWKLTGVFRDFADFAVLVLWDADCIYEHYTQAYLPSFDFAGVTWRFDLRHEGTVMDFTSPKNPWISWDALSYVREDGSSGTIKWERLATLAPGSPAPVAASATVTLESVGGAPGAGDAVALNYLDIAFQHDAGASVAGYVYFAGGTGAPHTVRAAGLDLVVTAATNASPIALTTATAHGLSTGQRLRVRHCAGNAAANGDWIVTVTSPTQLTLDGSTGSGAYAGGGRAGRARDYTYVEVAGDSGRHVAAGVAAAVAGDPWVAASAVLGAGTVTNATNASPIVLTLAGPHGLATGNAVDVAGVTGNTAANGAFIVTVTGPNQLSLDGSAGNGAYAGGGAVTRSNVCFMTATADDGVERVVTDLTDGNAESAFFGNGPHSAAAALAGLVNSYDWITEQPAVALLARNPVPGEIELTAARFGTATAAGTTVTWASGHRFAGLAPGDAFRLGGVAYAVATVTSAESLTLTVAPPAGTAPYLAPRGGEDGNLCHVAVRSTSSRLRAAGATALGARWELRAPLAGGSYAGVTWRISVDFDALGITSLRQMWLTVAPRLTLEAYPGEEWEIAVTNHVVTDPGGVTPLKVAGPGSTRTRSKSPWCKYQGTGWVKQNGFFNDGAARASSVAGDRVHVTYSCQHAHDLYLGTSLYSDRGTWGVRLDGGAETLLDCALAAEPSVETRRLLRTAVPAGEHVVTLRAVGDGVVYFDYLEAAVPAAPARSVERWPRVAAAMDYGTDHTYKLSPARLVRHHDYLGFDGDMNLYTSVFWWNQRRRVAGTNRTYNVQMSGTWLAADSATVTISGVPMRRTLRPADVDAGDATVARRVLARSIVDRMNATFVGVWCEVTGVGEDVVTVHTRTALFDFTTAASASSAGSGAVSATGNLDPGSEGVWEVDPDAVEPLNVAARAWLADYFAELAALGRSVWVAYSMEILNPPDAPGAVYAGRYPDGIQVLTATGFGTEAQAYITGATNASPIVITATAHGWRSGDPILVNGVTGNTAANGSWEITVLSADTVSLNGSTGNGAYAGGGLARRALRTTHCTFSEPMLELQKTTYKSTADLMAAAGLTPKFQFGEFLWWFFSRTALRVTAATNASPIALTLSGPHGLATGARAVVAGVRGNTAANGTWAVTVTSPTQLTLNGSTGSGAYVAGSGEFRSGGMGFYDDETVAAAALALGRPLATFWTQDDPEALTTKATDAAFLADWLGSYARAIRDYVRLTHPTAKFEVLFADDVSHPTCYHTLDMPFPQGGRVNQAVNTPPGWIAPAPMGDLDRMKIEALSWGSFYRNRDKSRAAIEISGAAPWTWPKSKSAYLVPWFNGGCAWEQEYRRALSRHQDVLFWAHDHLVLLAIPWPPPPARTNSGAV